MNIAEKLIERAALTPGKKAIVFPRRYWGKYRYESLSFDELNSLSDHFAARLQDMGFKKGHKTLLFVRPSLDFTALVFALFKLGVVPVLIDPGMGRKNLLQAISQVKPDGLIAEAEVHLIRLFFSKFFKSVKLFVTAGGMRWGIMKRLRDLKKGPVRAFEMRHFDGNELAAILFTSGGTGSPKGVEYTHRIFWQQTEMLQQMFQLNGRDVDVPGFPLFGLFTVAMGMTSAIPDMNPAKPAKCNPKRLVRNIRDNQATFLAGSPAIWERVADYCLQKNVTLESVRALVMFGAPVRMEIHQAFQKILPNGDTFTPYGATECLPVSNASGRELLARTRVATDNGQGTCIGVPVEGMQVKIIKISDFPLRHLEDAEELDVGQIGEIVVSGPTVTHAYYDAPKKTREAKCHDHQNRLWHRMGDIGYLDEAGRLWFCGRKTHRVETEKGLLSSVQCEAIFNRHPAVRRSALVGLGRPGQQVPAIVVETKNKRHDGQLTNELLELAGRYPTTENIQQIYYAKSFPVDVRHNIKIDRLLLRDQVREGRLR